MSQFLTLIHKAKMKDLFLSVLFLAVFLPVKVSGASGTDVNNLLTDLFTTKSYNKKIRPLTNQDEVVQVNVDFFLNGEF